ncbi:hypothetical protein ACTXJT_13220 [Corynebacterium casei]|uniref:hypothetical protein n=1 Tax=Corynebacterium casei TaxID=160386 RepID=UPI003FD49F3B
MFQFVVGAAAGYVLGTKAGRKRFHQIKNAYEKTINSPVTKKAVDATRRSIANRLDPEPRLREIKDLNRNKKNKNGQAIEPDRIYEVDED